MAGADCDTRPPRQIPGPSPHCPRWSSAAWGRPHGESVLPARHRMSLPSARRLLLAGAPPGRQPPCLVPWSSFWPRFRCSAAPSRPVSLAWPGPHSLPARDRVWVRVRVWVQGLVWG